MSHDMRSTFSFKDTDYEVKLEKKEKGEGDKHNPYAATVSGQAGGDVTGTFQLTDDLLKGADERAQGGSGDAGTLLARACGRSIVSELVIRKLKPDFNFVVDYRWLD